MDAKLTAQLKRVKGQVGGIERMVAEDRDCEAVLTQISAAMNSLKSVARDLLAREALECAGSRQKQDDYGKLLKRFF